MTQEAHYTVSIPDVHAHIVEVVATIPAPEQGPLDLTMPSWSPGSYLLREYGRHVQAFSASDAEGNPLSWAKRTRNTWRIDAPNNTGPIAVRYRLFCHDLNVRANHVENTHAFLNGPSVFMRAPHCADRHCTVRIEAPFEDWRIHTAMPVINGERAPLGTGHFEAEDFDVLVDCPVVMGPFEAIEFTASNTRQRLVMVGDHNAPIERLTSDMAQTVEATGQFFGGIPYREYLTIVLHSDSGRGGLEHRNSTVLMFPRDHYQTEAGYEDYMALFSHEHFHVWNVKRIRPAVLGPFDYANENYTRALWIMEGVTCYYENIMLLRAGLMTQARFLELLGSRIGALQNIPGRALHSLEDASFDAWIKLYRPDESTPNTTVSYYLKGEVVAWALDLTIRSRSGGKKSLDDVLLHYWARYEVSGAGFPEEDFQSTVESIAGCDLDDFFAAYVRGTDELAYGDLLGPVGMTLVPKEAPPEHGWLGIKHTARGDRLKVQTVFTGSPAESCGLYAGDELVALGGYKTDPKSVTKLLERTRPGDTLQIHAFRRGKLITTTATLGAQPVLKYMLEASESASSEARALRQDWLGAEPPNKDAASGT